MLKIEKTVTPSPEQWMMTIEGMRNPMNSWVCIDSYITHIEDPETLETAAYAFFAGEKDLGLMRRLAHCGPVHAKYRRMLPVWVTITAPLYWWKEFDTYKIGTVCNSCSTMHKIHSRDLTREDFSVERMIPEFEEGFNSIIAAINVCREAYIKTKEKKYWDSMIQLLPSSYNQTRTIMLNYEVLVGIYRERRNHKLDEWHVFCDWIKELPYSELITACAGLEAKEEK